MIERLFEAGVDVFRINMSHSPFDLVKKVHAAVRTAEANFGRPIGILCDLQGPKFRVGNIAGERVALAEGSTFRFDTTEAEGGAERNFYCMKCDGVIPHDTTAKVCPHCGASIEGGVRRYFNWVEMNEPPKSDFRALLPLILAGLAAIASIFFAIMYWLA